MLIYTNAIDFPDIVFSANDIEIIQNKAKVKGVLSFGGTNRDIISDVDILITDNILFSGKIVIKLSDFKITRPSLLFKKIDDEIYSLNENIRFLENRLKDTKLEHDYLSSSEKLLEYQKLYFEDSLQKKTIDEINTIEILNNKFLLNKLKM